MATRKIKIYIHGSHFISVGQGWSIPSLRTESCVYSVKLRSCIVSDILSVLLFSLLVMSGLCDPMDCSTPGFPDLHQLPELAQIHVHWVGDAIQPSHPLLSPSPAFSFSQHQSLPMSQLFTLGGQSSGASASASVVLPLNIQGWFPWGLTGLISLLSKGLSRVFFNTTVQKHQFFSTQPSL